MHLRSTMVRATRAGLFALVGAAWSAEARAQDLGDSAADSAGARDRSTEAAPDEAGPAGEPARGQPPSQEERGSEQAAESEGLVAWPERVETATPAAKPGADEAMERAPQARLIHEGEERPLPDYDRREDRTTAGEVLLWVPRVVLSPVYFVTEYVVRRPIGWLATTAEKNQWPSLVANFLTFGPEESMGIIPTGLIDFGLRPSVGLYYFWDDAGVKGNYLRSHVAWGGEHWYSATLTDRFEFGPEHDITLRGEFKQRPDSVHNGIGPRAGNEDEARFQQRVFHGLLAYRNLLPRSSLFEARVGARHSAQDGSITCCEEPSVNTRIAQNRFLEPPGMNDEYGISYSELRLVLDSRPRRFPPEVEEGSDYVSPPGTGLRFTLKGGYSVGLTERQSAPDPGRYHWVDYGASVGGFADLTGEQRVLGLTLTADFVDPVGDSPEIPVTEQVQLGGRNPLPGGLGGRLVDRSAATAKVSYQWPIWVWVDGEAFYEMGNVFGERLEAFEWGLLRSSFGMGLRANSSRDHVFQLLIAFLTDPIDEGHAISDVRFVFGASNEF